MINTRLVIALEELFKKEPFNLENDTFTVRANRGTIYITDYESSESISYYQQMSSDYEFAINMNYELNDDIGYYERRCERLERKLKDNDIEFR
jgi:hypothetical protein